MMKEWARLSADNDEGDGEEAWDDAYNSDGVVQLKLAAKKNNFTQFGRRNSLPSPNSPSQATVSLREASSLHGPTNDVLNDQALGAYKSLPWKSDRGVVSSYDHFVRTHTM